MKYGLIDTCNYFGGSVCETARLHNPVGKRSASYVGCRAVSRCCTHVNLRSPSCAGDKSDLIFLYIHNFELINLTHAMHSSGLKVLGTTNKLSYHKFSQIRSFMVYLTMKIIMFRILMSIISQVCGAIDTLVHHLG